MIQINTLDKGIYYVGDPTKLLPSSIYDGIWGELYKYMPGLYSAHGYQFLIYETFHDENTIIYTDNIHRRYKIESNTICIAPKEIVNESSLDDIVSFEVEKVMNVYHNKENLYFNVDDNIFYINIGKQETFEENDSDNESTTSLTEYIKKVSMEEYDNEFNIHYSSDEEDNFDPNDIIADDIFENKKNIEDDNQYSNDDEVHQEIEDEDEDEEDIKPKTVFFKQKR